MRRPCQSLPPRSLNCDAYVFKEIRRETTVSNVELCRIASVSSWCSKIKYQSQVDCQTFCKAFINQFHHPFILLMRTHWNLFLAVSTLRGLSRKYWSRSSASYHLKSKPECFPTRLPTLATKVSSGPQLKASVIPLLLSPLFHESRPRLRISFNFCRRSSC